MKMWTSFSKILRICVSRKQNVKPITGVTEPRALWDCLPTCVSFPSYVNSLMPWDYFPPVFKLFSLHSFSVLPAHAPSLSSSRHLLIREKGKEGRRGGKKVFNLRIVACWIIQFPLGELSCAFKNIEHHPQSLPIS